MDMNKIIAILFLLCAAISVSAQDNPTRLECYGGYDARPATGGRGLLSARIQHDFGPTYGMGLGMELATGSRASLDLRGQAVLKKGEKGRLYLENRYLYRQFAKLDVQEFTGCLSLGWESPHWVMELGLNNRYSAPLVQRSQEGMSTLFEPMNVMFALQYRLGVSPRCDLALRWSNGSDYVIERVSQWFYSLRVWYRLDKVTLFGEAGIHPVGSLNLTSAWDGGWARLGCSLPIK